MVSRYSNCSPMTETVRVILKNLRTMANYNQTHRTGIESAVCSGLTLELLANHNFDYIKTILEGKKWPWSSEIRTNNWYKETKLWELRFNLKQRLNTRPDQPQTHFYVCKKWTKWSVLNNANLFFCVLGRSHTMKKVDKTEALLNRV